MRQKLWELMYSVGGTPDPEIFLGPGGESTQWSVQMLSGPIPDMGGWLRHRKIFHGTRNGVIGRNILRDGFEWGYFDVVAPATKTPFSQEPLVLDYSVTKMNGRASRLIVDHIRTTRYEDVLVGKFHVRRSNGLLLLGYFTLTKI
jgi:hypothetical protein